jgi:hypothetical protein
MWLDILVSGLYSIMGKPTLSILTSGNCLKLRSNATMIESDSSPAFPWDVKHTRLILLTMQSALDIIPTDVASDLLHLLVESVNQHHSTNILLLRESMDFLRRCVLNHYYFFTFREVWCKWILMIPRYLWELRAKKDDYQWVETCLETLNVFLSQETEPDVLHQLQIVLIPLLCFRHPIKSMAAKRIYGPFVEWNLNCQKLFCATIAYFEATIDEKLIVAWITCLQSLHTYSEIPDYMLDIWQASTPKFPVSQYINVIMALMTNETSDSTRNQVG